METEPADAKTIANKLKRITENYNFFVEYLGSSPFIRIDDPDKTTELMNHLKTCISTLVTDRQIKADVETISHDLNSSQTLLSNLGIKYIATEPATSIPGASASASAVPIQQTTQKRKRDDNDDTKETMETVFTMPENTECSICLGQIKDTLTNKAYITSKCNNYFHTDCLNNWCRGKGNKCTCPMCRRILQTKTGGKKSKTNRRKTNKRKTNRSKPKMKHRKNKSIRNKRITFKRKN